MKTELERIAQLAAAHRDGARARGLVVGIGDDAAVMAPPRKGRLVWTIDEQVEGTHFLRDLVGWRDVGWRAFMAAASDVAAMGAEPWCALSALVLPQSLGDDAFDAIVLGTRSAAEQVGAPVIGGNLARGAVVSITTTLLGTTSRPIERDGAMAGDGLWLAGFVGRAAAGLRALTAGRAREDDPCVEAWRRPVARIDDGLAMAAVAHAAIDVSDGLAQDVGHLAAASGLAAVLDERALREDEALAEAATRLAIDPMELVLHGGEDYALVAASAAPIRGFRRIGELREGEGVFIGDARVPTRGFDHFARR